jgi:tetratricopeptide (TPR) repeat protein
MMSAEQPRLLEFIKRLFRPRPAAPEPGSLVEELWLGSMTDRKAGRFLEIDAEGYSAHYARSDDEEGRRPPRLELRLERPNLFAWTEAPLYRYSDFALEGELSMPEKEPYSACGFLFRYQDEGNFYALLVSNRGYFRLDLVLGGKPRALVGWTEIPESPPAASAPQADLGFSLRVIARGEHFTITIDDRWVAEAVDDSFDSGYVAFAAQRYGPAEGAEAGPPARFELGSCLIESRPVELESWYYRYNYYIVPEAAARRRLAETFFAMGESLAAAVQLRRLERLRALDADELFLKAEAALLLGLQDEAEAALDACLSLDPGRTEAAEEKANLLYLRGRYLELREALGGLLPTRRDNTRLLCLSGHARFNLGDFAGAAEDYKAAADIDQEQALFRMNEARAWDQAGKKDAAAEAYLKAARLFAGQEADEDLELALGRLSALRPRSLEVKAIKAKALYRRGKKEEAAKLLADLVAKGAADSGSHYTLGLILAERGEGEKALERFEAALALEPEYPLYAFRYAERLFLLEQSGKRSRDGQGAREAVARAVARALELAPPEGPQRGWTFNLAGQEALSRDDLEAARLHLEAAKAALPGAPEIAINVADLESRCGRTEEALAALAPFPDDAACRNQAGNAYARAADLLKRREGDANAEAAEKADELLEAAVREYLKATSLDPGSAEYQANLAAADIELERYADAEERLRKALDSGGGARALLLTGNLARIYGDLPRAEAAYRLGLEAAPEDPALLAALGRTYLALRNVPKAESVARSLDKISAQRALRLRAEIEEATTEGLSCSSCGRNWRVPRDLPAQSAATIRAMPPDDSPAGACPRCGKIFCIACRKGELSDKRFTCPDCGEALKLSDNRLRYLVRESVRRQDSY